MDKKMPKAGGVEKLPGTKSGGMTPRKNAKLDAEAKNVKVKNDGQYKKINDKIAQGGGDPGKGSGA